VSLIHVDTDFAPSRLAEHYTPPRESTLAERFMRIVIGLACFACIGAMLAACDKPPISTSTTDNAQIKVDRLFEHDGCTVYRFFDDGVRYFVKCSDGSSRTEWTETYNCGKTICARSWSVQ
jgi:hypothetical protein